MALYIPHSIFRLARLLYVRPENFGPYYVTKNQQSKCLTRIYLYSAGIRFESHPNQGLILCNILMRAWYYVPT